MHTNEQVKEAFEALERFKKFQSSRRWMCLSILVLQIVVPVAVVALSYHKGEIDASVPFMDSLPMMLYLVPLKMAHSILPTELLSTGSWDKGNWRQSVLKLVGWIALLLVGIGAAAFAACKFYFLHFDYFYELVALLTLAISIYAVAVRAPAERDELQKQQSQTEKGVGASEGQEPEARADPEVEKCRDYSLIYSVVLLVAPPMLAMLAGRIVAGLGFAAMVIGFVVAQTHHHSDSRKESGETGEVIP